MNDFRCILGYPAETFARLTILISVDQLTVNFDYLRKVKKH